MADRSGEPPPPSYNEAQNYPQFDASGQPLSNLGPPLSQMGSIFTYNTPTTDHQQTYSTEPAGPPAPVGIPPRRPGGIQSRYKHPRDYAGSALRYGPEFDSYYGGFSVPPQAQGGGQSMSGPTAPMVAGYTTDPYMTCSQQMPLTTVYNTAEGRVETVPAGYNTTPLEFENSGPSEDRRKKIMIFACLLLLVVILVSIFAGVLMG